MSQNKKKPEFILYDSVDDGNRMDTLVFYLFHLGFSLYPGTHKTDSIS